MIKTGLSISIASLFAGYLLMAACSKPAPVRWEHGWKTSRIIASRHKNSLMGYTIGFEFPKNPESCDRAELSDFIEKNGGSVFQMGGYPGALIYATFKDVKDSTSADKKLQEILPEFEAVVERLR